MSYNRENELYLLKQIEPFVIFQNIGIKYKYNSQKKEYWHLSPWRSETEPSVKWIYKNGSWIWYDFGEGTGGSIIDFWIKIKQMDYKSTMQELRVIFLNQKEETTMKKEENQESNIESNNAINHVSRAEKDKRNGITYQIKKISNRVTNKALWEYLKSRAINIIPDWLKEVYWSQNGKNYFAVAIQDQNGNYICRNKYMKCNLGQDITYSLFKSINDNEKTVVVTEGLFDALTAYQIWNKKIDIISLNSVNNIQNLIADDILKNYKEIILALDNDNAGIKAKNEILLCLKNKENIIKILPIKEDLNKDFLNRNINLDEIETIYQNGIEFPEEKITDDFEPF